MEKITKNYLNELQNTPVTNMDTSEDISKVVKLPWIPIIGPKLRQAFRIKNIKTIFTIFRPKFKIVVMPNRGKAVT